MPASQSQDPCRLKARPMLGRAEWCNTNTYAGICCMAHERRRACMHRTHLRCREIRGHAQGCSSRRLKARGTQEAGREASWHRAHVQVGQAGRQAQLLLQHLSLLLRLRGPVGPVLVLCWDSCRAGGCWLQGRAAREQLLSRLQSHLCSSVVISSSCFTGGGSTHCLGGRESDHSSKRRPCHEALLLLQQQQGTCAGRLSCPVSCQVSKQQLSGACLPVAGPPGCPDA